MSDPDTEKAAMVAIACLNATGDIMSLDNGAITITPKGWQRARTFWEKTSDENKMLLIMFLKKSGKI